MVVQCTVCMNNNRKNKNISYFNYPKDAARRHEWLMAVGREDLRTKLNNYKTRQQYRICEEHFERDCIKFSKNRTMKYLRDNAFPKLNLPTNYELPAPQQQQQLLNQYFVTFDTQGPSSSGVIVDQGSSDPEEASATEFEVGVITEQLAGVHDPLDNVNSDQCRFCAKITKNCVDTADKPYLENSKMTLTLNDLNVEIDLNVKTRKVCRDCDRRLLDMFNFVKQVKNAQDALLNVSCGIEAAETLVVKTECESPTPDDNTEIDDDTKKEVKDSITIGETEFMKGNVFVNKKRKCDADTTQRTTKALKKVKVKDNKVTSANSGLVKEEAIEMDDVASTSDPYKTVHSEDKDTGPSVKSSEVDVATNALLNEMAGGSGSCEIKTEVLGT